MDGDNIVKTIVNEEAVDKTEQAAKDEQKVAVRSHFIVSNG
jgi:hypothetical protein